MIKKFKTLKERKQVDLIPYIQEYIKEYPETQVLIGVDSQNKRRNTYFALVIGLYRPGKGAHVLYCKIEIPRIRETSNRLMQEVWYSIEVAEEIKQKSGIKAKTIDIDINDDEEFESNKVLRSALGLVKGMGYEVRFKSKTYHASDTPMMCYAADNLVK